MERPWRNALRDELAAWAKGRERQCRDFARRFLIEVPRPDFEPKLADRGVFYVYRIYDLSGETLYVGKGSGKRLRSQKKRFGALGEILERFDNEKAAFEAERQYITIYRPSLNRNIGGAGGFHASSRPGFINRELKAMAPYLVRHLAISLRHPGIMCVVARIVGKYGFDEVLKAMEPHFWRLSLAEIRLIMFAC